MRIWRRFYLPLSWVRKKLPLLYQPYSPSPEAEDFPPGRQLPVLSEEIDSRRLKILFKKIIKKIFQTKKIKKMFFFCFQKNVFFLFSKKCFFCFQKNRFSETKRFFIQKKEKKIDLKKCFFLCFKRVIFQKKMLETSDLLGTKNSKPPPNWTAYRDQNFFRNILKSEKNIIMDIQNSLLLNELRINLLLLKLLKVPYRGPKMFNWNFKQTIMVLTSTIFSLYKINNLFSVTEFSGKKYFFRNIILQKITVRGCPYMIT